jgi:hypothetical protein
LLIPVVDLSMSLWPLRFGDVGWRYGAVGLVASALSVIVLLLYLLLLLAHINGDRQVSLILGVVSGTAAIALLPALVFFSLDALQIRATAAADVLPRLTTTSVQTLLKLGAGELAAALVCVAAFRSFRAGPRRTPSSVPLPPLARAPRLRSPASD